MARRLFPPKRLTSQHERANDWQDKDPLSRQAWKLTSIVWLVLTRALLPFDIERLVDIVPRLVMHLDRTDSHAHTKARDRFRKTRRHKLSGHRPLNR
jgi:hypothetical protein